MSVPTIGNDHTMIGGAQQLDGSALYVYSTLYKLLYVFSFGSNGRLSVTRTMVPLQASQLQDCILRGRCATLLFINWTYPITTPRKSKASQSIVAIPIQ